MVTRSTKLIDATRRLWETRCGAALTDESTREIVANTTGFFETLMRWERAEAERDGTVIVRAHRGAS